jgi:dipeptidyl aminopeptidase/acylaminoacyl peptidase
MTAMNQQMARRRSGIAAFLAKTAFVVALSASCGVLCNPATARDPRAFTVQDSIELSYFTNPVLWTVNQEPAAEPLPSPDGRYLLLVTERGILATNKLKSSIWVFEGEAVDNFVTKKSSQRPVRRRIVSWQATSNTPIISDVHWLQDSRRVAFLGRTGDGTSQLFLVDSFTGRTRQVTHASQSVSAYDIQGQTIAYTTFDERASASRTEGDLVDVTGKNIFTLLWSKRANRDREEALLLGVPNTLHIIKGGSESKLDLKFENKPLKLFFPVLSLAPNGKFLITVAPVTKVPYSWKQYQPRFGYEDLRLDRGNKWASAPENDWKPSQFVKIDLEKGLVTPLIDAPAGRSLFHIFAPTKAIWSPDSRTVLLFDTFLPLTEKDGDANSLRATAPAAVTFDVWRAHTLQVVAHFPQPARGSSPIRHVADVVWSARRNEITLRYASSPDNVSISFHESYRLTQSGWTKFDSSKARNRPFVSVYEDLNQPPILRGGGTESREPKLIWNPNPQLGNIPLGMASLYSWHDKKGRPRSGILVLPADYAPGKRYPLVIQTHGFEPNKFFADGIYTTGSGGRALCGRGMIVLQTEQYSKSENPQSDAEIEVEAFRSAVAELSADGLVDSRRVGIIGFSFTVYHTLYAMTHNPDLFAAASITDGNDLSYWLYLLWTDIAFAQQMGETANGGVKPFGKEGLLKWQESAPGFNLDRVRAPLLISCLEEGALVSTWDIYGGLRTLGKPVDLLWLRNEDAPHVLVQPRHRYLSQQTAVDWFDFWLNGHEDPSPEKAAEYARWHELRKLMDRRRQASSSERTPK